MVSWEAVGNKMLAVLSLVEKWGKMPPALILPDNWDNGTYWLNMLEAYTKARQSPEAIRTE